MSESLISSPGGVLAVLCAVAAFWFYIEQFTQWKIFNYVPPLLFIYATPVFLNNLDVISSESTVYSGLSTFALPAFIVLMLIKVNVPAAVRIMGKGVIVMLMGTMGVVVGAVVSYALVHRWLSEDAWQGFGALAGSWIGGTGNMAATSEMLGTSEEMFGLAVLADNIIYLIWLPILLGSRNFADRFNKWAGVDENRLRTMDAAAAAAVTYQERVPEMRDYIYLAAIVIGVTWIGSSIASMLFEWTKASHPDLQGMLTEATWRVLLITTIALCLSVTPVARLPNSTAIGTALIYIFVAGMGAKASVEGFAQAPYFLLGALIWIFIHGGFCLLGAKLFKVDVHTVAIASAANIGAAASAPIVAAFHRPSLVPVSILMALIGYAIGNYIAPLTGHLARIVAGQ